MKKSIAVSCLVILFFASLVFSIRVGATPVFNERSFVDIFGCFFSSIGNGDDSFCQIVNLRISRAFTAAFVGGALALSGAVLQSVLANPIADPFVLGISSGGTAAAILSTLFFSFLPFDAIATQSAFAFIGCLITFLFLSFAQRRLSTISQVQTLPVIGLILNSFFSAAILILLFIFSNQSASDYYRWFVGNIFEVSATQIVGVYFVGSAAALVLFRNAPIIKTLAFGDNFVTNLGFSAAKIRLLALLAVTLLIASTVSVSGAVGFIGLIVPHLMKNFTRGHIRAHWLASLVFGATLVMFSDALARSIAAPTELPVGLFTACFGIPTLAAIFWSRAKQGRDA